MLFAILVLGFTTFCYAEGQGLHQRVRDAHDRIDRGVHSGSLTREEAHSLKNQLNSICDDEARMNADGRLTHHERSVLRGNWTSWKDIFPVPNGMITEDISV